jgi:hypothetical protein
MMNDLVMEKIYDTGMTFLTTSVIADKEQRWILEWFKNNKSDMCKEIFGEHV